MYRHKMNRSSSKKYFSRSADRTHKKNSWGSSPAMRGGIRL